MLLPGALRCAHRSLVRILRSRAVLPLRTLPGNLTLLRIQKLPADQIVGISAFKLADLPFPLKREDTVHRAVQKIPVM